MKALLLAICATPLLQGAIIKDVRDAIAQGDFPRADAALEAYRKQSGVTPEWLEALSWMGRGALAAKKYDQAETYARRTYDLCLAELKKGRAVDADKNFPIALGASIEVLGQVLGARNQRSEAIAFLEKELAAYRQTSLRARLQKNIHLLSLEGKPAPAVQAKAHFGPAPKPLREHRGKPVLLFFWAHWCGDCKYQGPILARLQRDFAQKGLVIVAPTQRYGYVARGEDATPEQETAYIGEVWRQFYGELSGVTASVDEETFQNYGASTTPTLVLVDREGKVRMYHPGKMPYELLKEKVAAVAGGS
jgi:thiol-disulfide isomerase/thioredoxin